MTNEEIVKSKYPDAELLGLPHGKVAVWSPSVPSGGMLGYISDIMYLGTREQRRHDAWEDAAMKIKGRK